MKWTPPSVWKCFLLGLAWLWNEQLDFLLVFAVLAVCAISLGAWSGMLHMVAGGVALLLAMVFACIVYGSHQA